MCHRHLAAQRPTWCPAGAQQGTQGREPGQSGKIAKGIGVPPAVLVRLAIEEELRCQRVAHDSIMSGPCDQLARFCVAICTYRPGPSRDVRPKHTLSAERLVPWYRSGALNAQQA